MANTAATAGSIRALFAEVAHGGRTGDWRRSLNASNKILQLVPDDVKAFQCKVVSMVHLSQFQEVINLCKKNESSLAKHVRFERAYSLYRLNKAQEALNVLDSIVDGDAEYSSKVKELKAQVLYRLERCDECYDIYKDLIRNTQDDYEDERETNLSAVIANLHASNSSAALETTQTREDTYELAYNAACSLISQCKFSEALIKLATAEALCKKALEEDDDASEEEIDDELGINRVQRAYTMQMMGDVIKAANLYGQVLKQKPSDSGLAAVASNNIVAINGDQNIFDSKKKMKLATSNELEMKLTTRQRDVIALNHCLLMVHANQLTQCRELVEQLRKRLPHSADVVLIEAALHCREKNEDVAIDLLKKFLKDNPQDLIKIAFTLVELFLAQGMESKACETLKSLGNVSYKPGVVSALISLFLNLEDKESADELFKNCIKWYSQNDPKSGHLIVLWRASANFHINNGNAEAAAMSLEELRGIYPKDVKILAQLITAYSQFDAKKAILASKHLPPVDEVLSKNVDVDTLEATAWTTGSKYLRKGTKPSEITTPGVKSSGDSDQLLKKRKRKKKKGKLPKNYDPNVAPDPERWLPRKDRLTYKKRKDRNTRGTMGIGKGTQGSTAGNADIDASTKPMSTNVPRSNAVSNNQSPSDRKVRQDKPPQAMKKNPKKKASGKW